MNSHEEEQGIPYGRSFADEAKRRMDELSKPTPFMYPPVLVGDDWLDRSIRRARACVGEGFGSVELDSVQVCRALEELQRFRRLLEAGA